MEVQERKEWKTLHQINRPVFVAGLKPFQWVIAFIFCVSILFAVVMGSSSFKYVLLILPYPLYLGIKKLSKENDAGHPDYLSSVFVWVQITSYGFFKNPHFVDSTNVFTKLKKKSERAGTRL